MEICKRDGGHAWLPTSHFFEKIDRNKSHIRKRLVKLVDEGILERKQGRCKNNTWCYEFRIA